ncbi:MAG: SEC-C metal-binding domain-containing protein, partial [Candidatus Paceibacteria bacterium]
PHNVLNAKNHELEGQIIAQAGRLGQVTVATNMAGRGVDIILGGNPPDNEERRKVIELGGLHVIGTERHEARRIDNQLRGRSGRQGDPGSSQFFISLDDDVVRIFGGERIKNLMERLGFPEDQPIEHSLVSRAIEQAQSKIEGHYFDARRYVLEFDNVMNKHRETIYNLRRQIVMTDDKTQMSNEIQNPKSKIWEYIKEVIDELVEIHTQGPEWNTKEIEKTIKAISNFYFPISNLEFKNREELKSKISGFIKEKYDEKEKQIGETTMRQLEKFVLLRVIDELWIDHLEQMEYLRDSVNLRAYGQRDPLVEYRIEGQKMYEQLLKSIKYQVVNLIFKVGLAPQPIQQSQPLAVKPPSEKNIGRNDPCPCGSGKKYKHCCGKKK